MTLTHHSAQPFCFDPSRAYEQEDHFKPRGLWLSVDDDWRRWCAGEDFNTEGFAHTTHFELLPNAHVLILDTEDAIHAFTRRYSEIIYHSVYINWTQVSDAWDGVIIAPYQWGCRLDNDVWWYYSWDCASGCIWNLHAIRQVVLA